MMKHLACIMDGNRRWALNRGLMVSQGHQRGFESIKRVIDFCLKKQIPYLSLYIFSTENAKRPLYEQEYLFDVLAYEAVADLTDLKKKDVSITFAGDRNLFPRNIKILCDRVERETRECKKLQVSCLLFYGGRSEIVDATKRIAAKIKKGDLSEDDITEEVFEHFLWSSGRPTPELIVRTGGHKRLSNFLLFQAAYSELYFIDTLWPDITNKDLDGALAYYEGCKQNTGT
jgi:undecaprenyl diphosphate synthase